MKTYWNDRYWAHHLARPEQNDLFEQLWVRRHLEFINTFPRGTVLDLGCGIGQNTAFWREQGFSVVSADLSETALTELKRRIPEADTVALDMTRPLPFPDGCFSVIFTSLSMHYFDKSTTSALVRELHRILKSGGVVIGSVNASTAYRYIADHAVTLEENFFLDGERTVRLFDKPQLDFFFSDFTPVLVEYTHSVRFHEPKDMWEFIYRK